MRSRTVDLGGPVHLADFGGSGPTMVLVHGLGGAAQPRPPGTRFDPVVALTFAAYAVPGLGERFMRWRAARRGSEGLVRDTLQLVCADPGRVPAEVVAAHVALARDRMDRMPW